MATEKQKATLATKLINVMGAIGYCPKKGRNDFARYAYVKATDLAALVRVELIEQNIYMLSNVMSASYREMPAKDGVMQVTDIMVEYTFIDGDTGESLSFRVPGTAADKGDKSLWKAITGSLKYALRNSFMVPDEADPESDEKLDRAMAHRNKAESVAQEDAGRLRPGREPNRGHGDAGFEEQEPPAVDENPGDDPFEAPEPPRKAPPSRRVAPQPPPAPEKARKVAESIPGVSRGIPAKKTAPPAPAPKDTPLDLTETEGKVKDIVFAETRDAKKSKYLKVYLTDNRMFYVWDTKLHHYISKGKGRNMGFEYAEVDGRSKIVNILFIGDIQFEENQPVVEGE